MTRLIALHSPHERCGIAEYGRALDVAFRAHGVDLQSLPLDTPKDALLDQAARPDTTILVHYEPALVGPIAHLREALHQARMQGAKVVFCCHWFEAQTVFSMWDGIADRFVLHREYEGASTDPRVSVIPLGCPTYDPPAEGRKALRRKYGLPEDAIIVTTQGFLSQWKQTPYVTSALLALSGGRFFHQILTAIPYLGDAGKQKFAMQRVLHAARPDSVFFSTDFRPEAELLDRLHASDVGWLFHGLHTGSVSAATKAYVAARTPVVVTGSTHASDVQEGIVRIGNFSVPDFAQAVVALADSRSRIDELREALGREYERLSMGAVARRYLDLFQSLH